MQYDDPTQPSTPSEVSRRRADPAAPPAADLVDLSFPEPGSDVDAEWEKGATYADNLFEQLSYLSPESIDSACETFFSNVAADVGPDEPVGPNRWHRLARSLELLDRTDLAVRMLEQVLEEPASADPYYWLCCARLAHHHRRADRLSEAEAVLMKALERAVPYRDNCPFGISAIIGERVLLLMELDHGEAARMLMETMPPSTRSPTADHVVAFSHLLQIEAEVRSRGELDVAKQLLDLPIFRLRPTGNQLWSLKLEQMRLMAATGLRGDALELGASTLREIGTVEPDADQLLAASATASLQSELHLNNGDLLRAIDAGERAHSFYERLEDSELQEAGAILGLIELEQNLIMLNLDARRFDRVERLLEKVITKIRDLSFPGILEIADACSEASPGDLENLRERFAPKLTELREGEFPVARWVACYASYRHQVSTWRLTRFPHENASYEEAQKEVMWGLMALELFGVRALEPRAWLSNELGRIHRRADRQHVAIACFNDAYRAGELLGGSRGEFVQACAALNLLNCGSAGDDSAEHLWRAELALDVLTELRNFRFLPVTFALYNSIACAYIDKAEIEKAREFVIRGLRSSEHHESRLWMQREDLYTTWAEIAEEQGKYRAARRLTERARQLRVTYGSEDRGVA